MNSYPWISVGQIIGRIVRRAGIKDTSLIADINEWIAEVMEIMQITLTLSQEYSSVTSTFHKAKNPCGLVELYGVEYCGCRLPYNNTIRDPRMSWTPTDSPDVFDSVYVSSVTKENTPTGNHLYESEFQKVQSMKWHATEWYKTDGGFILTSFADGPLTLYYGKVPTDRDGFLMIPSEGNYKEAITWFVKARLSGRGYRDPDYTGKEMDAKWEVFAGRARESITLPSVEKAQATADTLTRLLPQADYYDSFYTGTGPENLFV